MTTTDPRIDTARLEKRRETANKITGRCPACAAEGGDRSGKHFFLNTSDKRWGCVAHQRDVEHRREIFRLVGVKGERQPDPVRDRQLRQKAAQERRETEARAKLVQTARERRAGIVQRWAWHPADLWESSPTRIDGPIVDDPRFFISTLFPQDAVVWTGNLWETGQGGKYADRWRTVAEWQESPAHEVGPMVSPCTWPPGTISRAGENVLAARFAVLDFDELDGRKPETPDEIEALHAIARAITRWLAEGLKWRLAAIVATGGKSLHAWFHNPGPAALTSIHNTAGAWGIDAGLVKNPEHPARLPGQRHAKTGGMSQTLWLQLSP